jgi:hypothetical protein
MVNNFTKIYKTITPKQRWSTNLPISTKQSPLDSDGHQFHQDQQNKQSPEVIVCFVDICGIDDHHCLEVIVCFDDIGGLVGHHCLEVNNHP